ncbi:MAG TPA: 2-dehydropantoate 2-reductase [Ktedonobacterales bacterium]
MRIAVIGAGGTGGYFGGLLARAGEDVTLVARGTQLAAILAEGLTVHSRRAGDFTIPIPVTGDTSEVGPVDFVLFCVKTYDAVAAAAQLPPLIGPDTAVLSVLNGVDSVRQLADVVGEPHMLGGVAMVTASVTAPGVVTQTGGQGAIALGELNNAHTPRVEAIADVLEHAGIPATVPANIHYAMWQKFAFICAFATTALTRLPIGNVLGTPATRDLYEGIAAEVEAVTRAVGAPVPPDMVATALHAAEGFEPWTRSSLAHDLASGHRLELDALNGAVVRLGRAHNVPTPLNFALYAALAPYLHGAPRVAAPPAE